MFFMIGIGQREAELPLDQTCVCLVCGRFGRLQVRMSYTCLTLFFLPVLKWGIRYAASMGCCGAGCELDPQLGRRLACGELRTLDPGQLPWAARQRLRRCRQYGYETAEDFTFCPKCGIQF